jgi:uncharacterized protein
MLRLVAARHAATLNVAELARAVRLPENGVYRYLEILEAIFLIRRVPPWATNLSKRETRAPKIYILDPGLASHLRDADIATLSRPELASAPKAPSSKASCSPRSSDNPTRACEHCPATNV